jgi:hypothetical protein
VSLKHDTCCCQVLSMELNLPIKKKVCGIYITVENIVNKVR